MNPSRRALFGMAAAVGGALALPGTAAATPVPGAMLPGGRYDRYLRRLADADQFSGTVQVAYRDHPVLTRSYGMADKEQGIPNRTDTVYALASASKPFTGLAVVQLAEQDKLRFHDTLGMHLGGFAADVAGKVTVHHLLTHTSGLAHPGPAGPEHIFTSVEERTAYLARRTREMVLKDAPGTTKAYNSPAYDLLGELVATVSGKPFHTYVLDHIFTPAGMGRSAYHTRPEWLSDPRIAHPYALQADGSRVDCVRHLDKGAVLGGAPGSNSARGFIGSGGGNGFSTAPDLLSFARALREGKLLGRAYHELYVNGKISAAPMGPVDPLRGESFHAYGPVAGLYRKQRVLGHGGGIAGGSTNWSIYLDRDWTGVVLCNYDLDVEAIIAEEREAVLG
ncbi:serine hydrolase [Amycolatopsis sp. 195334CR]|uniref:serine hydrolase domain-containing protein n=1 Tax=Amycolatopsis sp. 195334CR TaxID=2814588 RepID=UPI001A90B3F4|nr:serine hydrolase domain-containing protein [Amycolatopsis sp. 195334CR]MBN6039368.1 beta-lactamase family protein [Amycolatopsis sp. 195334CR]